MLCNAKLRQNKKSLQVQRGDVMSSFQAASAAALASWRQRNIYWGMGYT